MVQADFQFIADLPVGYVVVGADIELTYRMSDVSAMLRYLDRSDLYDWGKRQLAKS